MLEKPVLISFQIFAIKKAFRLKNMQQMSHIIFVNGGDAYVRNINGRWTAKFMSPNIVLLKPAMNTGIKKMIFKDIILKLKADP